MEYDITKFKDHIRFLEVCINRDGIMGGICPLLFDGAVCDFKELPKPKELVQLTEIYEQLKKLESNEVKENSIEKGNSTQKEQAFMLFAHITNFFKNFHSKK